MALYEFIVVDRLVRRYRHLQKARRAELRYRSGCAGRQVIGSSSTPTVAFNPSYTWLARRARARVVVETCCRSSLTP
jgi:hypothetical protein